MPTIACWSRNFVKTKQKLGAVLQSLKVNFFEIDDLNHYYFGISDLEHVIQTDKSQILSHNSLE